MKKMAKDMHHLYNWILCLCLLFGCSSKEQKPAESPLDKPNVIITTDINHAGGDPDDKQSLVHLLWYANELDIRAIVPERWNGKGYEASMEVMDAYKNDFDELGWASLHYPEPESLRNLVAKTPTQADSLIISQIEVAQTPVYVLVWGNMTTIKNVLVKRPDLSDHIRLLSIGTGLKYGPQDEVKGDECDVPNWNGKGRDELYNDPRFSKMWWLENNWTYNGMFMGDGPAKMLDSLSLFGNMGYLIKHAVKDDSWAQYFRVGDTPSVLYLIDNRHNIDDPESSSWAGKFKKPFPVLRPYYFTDDDGDLEWNYADPCASWHLVEQMYAYNKSTLAAERNSMYESLLAKLHKIYHK
jgi:hypothetical protein